MLRSALAIPQEQSGLEFRSMVIVECAVNVSYGHNQPSTFSYFCNPDDTFRASVFWG